MGTMKLSVATVEMADGTVHENVRITLQDRLRLERTARTRKWDLANANYAPSVNAFLAWSAVERAGLIGVMTFEDFIAGGANDVNVDSAEAELGDPTQRAATTD